MALEPRPARSRPQRRRSRALPLVVAVLVGAAGTGIFLSGRDGDAEPPDPHRTRSVRACEVPVEILQRVWNGYVPRRSGDVLAIERLPNQFNTRHSTPFPYTQDVPLVLYGPGFIRAGVTSDRPVTVADIAPTWAELLRYEGLGQRDGRVLEEALTGTDEVPRLIVTIVWDGGGDNVLEQWPDDWPHLKRVMERGTSYSQATVGSSPSITPSIHATIGTGSFPRTHGLSDTKLRVGKEEIVDAWEGVSPRYLRIETLADLWDRDNGNEPLVALFARDAWHLGMMGHGSYLEGGDRDIAVMDDFGQVEFRDPKQYYELPSYLLGNEGLDAAIAEVDARDGELDQRWMDNPLLAIDGRIRETPAWAIYQTEKTKQLLTTEGFGQDGIADLFFINYKPTDLVGHSFNMVEPEEGEVLAEQDRQLAELLRFLDGYVGRGNYVMALTSDHGMTPYPSVTGGWSIVMSEMEDDINEAFGEGTVRANRGYQVFVSREAKRKGVRPGQVAAFLRDYTIRQNAPSPSDVPDAFKNRLDEKVFLTALTPAGLEAALGCAGGDTG